MTAYLIPPRLDAEPLQRWLDSLDPQERLALMVAMNAPGSPALNLPDPEPEMETA